MPEKEDGVTRRRLRIEPNTTHGAALQRTLTTRMNYRPSTTRNNQVKWVQTTVQNSKTSAGNSSQPLPAPTMRSPAVVIEYGKAKHASPADITINTHTVAANTPRSSPMSSRSVENLPLAPAALGTACTLRLGGYR